MQQRPSQLYQRQALIARIDPGSYAAGTQATDVFDLATLPFRRVIAWVFAGTLGSSATLDFKFQNSNASGGTYNDVSSSLCKIPQITASSKQESLEFAAEAVCNLGIGFTFFKGLLTIGTATSMAGAAVFGADCRFNPASTYNLTSVLSNTVYVAP